METATRTGKRTDRRAACPVAGAGGTTEGTGAIGERKEPKDVAETTGNNITYLMAALPGRDEYERSKESYEYLDTHRKSARETGGERGVWDGDEIGGVRNVGICGRDTRGQGAN